MGKVASAPADPLDAALDHANPGEREIRADKRKNQPFNQAEHANNPSSHRFRASQPNVVSLGQIDENFAQFFRGIG